MAHKESDSEWSKYYSNSDGVGCNPREIIKAAKDEIERLRSKIKVAVEAERESCAMIAERHGFICECDAEGTAYKAASEHIASAIRKREKDD